MKTGIELIAAERQEQIKKHKRTRGYDMIVNQNRELVMGATALISDDGKGDPDLFPFEWDDDICRKMFGKSYKQRLIIAGALIAAEIDRILPDEGTPFEEK